MSTPETAPERLSARRILALVLVGVIGGVLSGAFGVGGGIVMVPLLIWLTGMDQRRAAATSLVAIVPTAIAGAATYAANGEVDLVAALLITVGGVVGSYLGTRLLKSLPLGWLRWLFVGLMVLAAVRLLFEVPGRGEDIAIDPLVAVLLVVLGLVMGIAAGLFGVGGGIIMVPALVALFGVSDLLAKGTSLLAMIPTALTGSINNLRNRLMRPVEGLIAGLAATASSFAGVALAFLMPPEISGVLFAALLVLAAVQLSVRAVRAQRAAKAAREG